MTKHCVSNFNFESNKYGKFYRNINYLLPDNVAQAWLKSRLVRAEPTEKNKEKAEEMRLMKEAFSKRNGEVVLR